MLQHSWQHCFLLLAIKWPLVVTIIHSDEWTAYNRISSLCHLKVNHSLRFVDPVTGNHTQHLAQHVELYWNYCKTNMKRMKGCVKLKIPSYLNEFMWRERYRTSQVMAFHNILQNKLSESRDPLQAIFAYVIWKQHQFVFDLWFENIWKPYSWFENCIFIWKQNY